MGKTNERYMILCAAKGFWKGQANVAFGQMQTIFMNKLFMVGQYIVPIRHKGNVYKMPIFALCTCGCGCAIAALLFYIILHDE